MTNKKKLARELSKRTLLTNKESEQVVDELFEIIYEKLQEDEEVSIVGFGKFYMYEHKPRPVRNPKTQKTMTLQSYKSIRFKSSNILKKLLKEQANNDDL
jgi:nucleoid DNA-binding protein